MEADLDELPGDLAAHDHVVVGDHRGKSRKRLKKPYARGAFIPGTSGSLTKTATSLWSTARRS
jgi:hypothetical protein